MITMLGEDRNVLGEAAAFDINNLVNAFSNTINQVFGQKDTTADEKNDQLQVITASYAAQFEAMARQNQTMILTVGGLAAAGLVAFMIFRKK